LVEVGQGYLAGVTGAGVLTGAGFGQQEAANSVAATAMMASLRYFMVRLRGWLLDCRMAVAAPVCRDDHIPCLTPHPAAVKRKSGAKKSRVADLGGRRRCPGPC